MGCRVVAQTTSPDKEGYLRDLGAHEVLVDATGAAIHKHGAVQGGVRSEREALGVAHFYVCGSFSALARSIW